ncbi:MAG: hypothetical protein EOP88_24445, partial [Verrucomicrobiaceae bacterium]
MFGNIVIFGIAGFATLEAERFRRTPDRVPPATVPKEESTVLISPDMLQAVKEEKAATPPAPDQASASPQRPSAAPDFTRTSEDQRGKRPDKPMFIGERDTEATSDTTPDPNAKPMPSQRGIDPRDES